MPTWKHNLNVDSKIWCNIEISDIMAVGRLSPRLILWMNLTAPTERIQVKLHHVVGRILCDREIIGVGVILGEEVQSSGSHIQVEIQTTRQMLDYVTAHLAQASDVSLSILWHGLIHVMWKPNESNLRMADDPLPEEWKEYLLRNNGIEQHLSIARSDWYSKVLQPIGNNDFLYLEVAVPKGEVASQWGHALSHLSNAEKCFALGDDAGVFSKLKGMCEALPGAPKNIVDNLPHPKKEEVSKLLKSYIDFLNHGRHVVRDGENAGQFPINRIDSENAIALGKVMISYISRLLGSVQHHD